MDSLEIATSKAVRICSEEECGRPHQARGYCHGHYQQLRQGRPITPLRYHCKSVWTEGEMLPRCSCHGELMFYQKKCGWTCRVKRRYANRKYQKQRRENDPVWAVTESIRKFALMNQAKRRAFYGI